MGDVQREEQNWTFALGSAWSGHLLYYLNKNNHKTTLLNFIAKTTNPRMLCMGFFFKFYFLIYCNIKWIFTAQKKFTAEI